MGVVRVGGEMWRGVCGVAGFRQYMCVQAHCQLTRLIIKHFEHPSEGAASDGCVTVVTTEVNVSQPDILVSL